MTIPNPFLYFKIPPEIIPPALMLPGRPAERTSVRSAANGRFPPEVDAKGTAANDRSELIVLKKSARGTR